MNAKELIHKAYFLLDDDEPKDWRDWQSFSSVLANYVLKTIKEDDDELLTKDFILQLETPEHILIGIEKSGGFAVYACSGTDDCKIAKIKTRGQLRRLLEALGVIS